MVACDALVDDALSRARRVQEGAAEAGFDWTDVSDVLEKLREEIGELEQALAGEDLAHVRHELGDVLFTTVNLSRFLHASPGEELESATQRFCARFEALKAILDAKGRTIQDCTIEELDRVWEQVKRKCSGADGHIAP